MKREYFLKTIGIGSVILVSGASLFTSCIKAFGVPLSLQFSNEDIKLLINQAKENVFSSNKSQSNKDYTILFCDTYDIREAKKDKKNNDIDYLLKIECNGMLKCNFNIFHEPIEIRETIENKNTIIVLTKNPNQRIKIIRTLNTYEFPIKLTPNIRGVKLDERFKVPFFISKNEFANSIDNPYLINLIKG